MKRSVRKNDNSRILFLVKSILTTKVQFVLNWIGFQILFLCFACIVRLVLSFHVCNFAKIVKLSF